MYTYFFSNTINSYIKIGRTKNPLSRKNGVRGQISFIDINIEYYIEGDYEAYLHEYYAPFRTKGEWFDIPLPTKEFVLDIVKKNVRKEGITPKNAIINKDYHYKFSSNLLPILTKISAPAIKLYSYLLLRYAPAALIGINDAIKKDIMEVIKSKGMSTVSNSLTELCKNNLLWRKPGTRGGYYINSRYAFKGSTTDRNQSLKMLIEMGCTDC